MKTILITGIGGLTPRSIATIIRENHPDYKIVGCDIEKKAMGFFMKTKDGKKLIDEYYIAPRCTSPEYFPWMEKLVAEKGIDYAFVQPEAEIVEWGQYYEDHGSFPCPVFMGCKLLSESLREIPEITVVKIVGRTVDTYPSEYDKDNIQPYSPKIYIVENIFVSSIHFPTL